MPTTDVALRVHKLQVVPTPAVGLRVHKIQVVTTPTTFAALRIHKIQVVTTPGVRLAPLASQTVEPETLITRTASVLGGIGVDSWAWRIVENTGLPVTLTTAGPVCSFHAPSDAQPELGDPPQVGASITVGVKAVKDGKATPERFFTISTLPQTQWVADGLGPWRGAPRPF